MNRREWLLTAVVVTLMLAPSFAPYDAMRTEPAQALLSPTAAHLLGTDALGRDTLSRVMVGGQRTLLQAMIAVALAALAGVLTGAFAAFGPSPVAAVLRALTAAVLAVPPLVWSLALLALLGTGPGPLVIALAVPLAAPMAAMCRPAFVALRARPFVWAARATGSTEIRIVTRHILPNSMNLIGRYCAVLFTYAVLNAAGLAFLGFSQPGEPEWGTMLAEARGTFRASPWPALATGLAMTLLVWAALALTREREEATP
jgi:ABC-type dipeptide/oligopeptide/nickel transport system permease subunit